MGVNPIQPNPISQTQLSQGTSAQNEVQQMVFIFKDALLGIAWYLGGDWASGGDGPQQVWHALVNMSAQFDALSKQSPPNLQALANLLNQAIDIYNKASIGPPFPQWDLSQDQKKPGYSFVGCMLTLAQELAGNFPQKMNAWVTTLAQYLNQTPWPDAGAVYSKMNEFIKTVQSLGYNQIGFNLPMPNWPSNNIFL